MLGLFRHHQRILKCGCVDVCGKVSHVVLLHSWESLVLLLSILVQRACCCERRGYTVCRDKGLYLVSHGCVSLVMVPLVVVLLMMVRVMVILNAPYVVCMLAWDMFVLVSLVAGL